MRNILNVIIVLLILSWMIGFFGYSAKGLIHYVLVLAIILIFIRVIQSKKVKL